MSALASGSRAARLLVEQGRILEDELNRLADAEACYVAAREADPALTSAFLAVERVARLRGDDARLSALYVEEAERSGEPAPKRSSRLAMREVHSADSQQVAPSQPADTENDDGHEHGGFGGHGAHNDSETGGRWSTWSRS